MKAAVLKLLHTKYDLLPDWKKNMPYFNFQDEKTLEHIQLSPNDAIREVSNLTDLGKKLILAEIFKANRVTQ